MSQSAPCGRATPRWSALTGFPDASVHALTGIAFIAGLVAGNAMVEVGPPLFTNVPSSGSTVMPGQLASGQLRFPPPSTTSAPWEGLVPEQFGPDSPLTMLFLSVSVPGVEAIRLSE